MTTQLLIYETAVAISNGRHGKCSVDRGGYTFSRNINAVPLMAVEFPSATSEYAIVFAGKEDTLMPSVILGMRGKENAYLDADDGWRAKYVPAFIRRYPFVFSKSEDGQTFTLCIDEAFAGFNREGRGQALFSDEGKPTPYVENVLKFLQDYQSQFQRTRAFCEKLQQLDLLEPMQATMSLETGENLSLTGFMAINRKKLKELPADTLADLAKTDELELIYLHLHSMRNFNNARERLVVIPGGKAEPAKAPEAEQEAPGKKTKPREATRA
jgi:hypothetical protein